ncbi:MAG: bifunctional UDP-3-O-[3-hydroxymyristoyl] N-acetylglucosamine deacetylase/3-hydroxyacyl-ACP dehydratase [Gemmatimonadetes bacterium]|nr:bifunctional UDP-3-O-[3-hydroxymyristoyl] N-acetylglucosamine deacetylase/3-hydroxyacyl-ACP dehydratase [Gemmatimonadota bacterium]
MSEPRQQTLAASVTLEGVGTHTGKAARLTLGPAEPGTGRRFRRVDLDGSPEIPAHIDHVVATELGTTLGLGETRVATVEHVLAALAALDVDNALLELDGPETPIMDGSFLPFVDAIERVGVVEQDEPARVIEVLGPVQVADKSGPSYVATPSDGLRISATIDFEHPAIGRLFGSYVAHGERFAEELAPARTFGFRADAEALRARGLALGSSLDNAVILDDDGVMNPDGLRFPDEFIRHKVGDIVGDLALTGARIQGHIVAERPSHAGNMALARTLADHALYNGGQPIVDASQIMQHLPHRYPMLLVDRITGYEKGKRIVGIKNVTINEPFFQGHYPGHPIMPGVLIIEAMAQVGGLLLMDQIEDPESKVVYFMSLDNVKWRRPVTPGDQIVFELELVQFRRHVCRLKGVGRVDGKVAAEAELMARIMDR